MTYSLSVLGLVGDQPVYVILIHLRTPSSSGYELVTPGCNLLQCDNAETIYSELQFQAYQTSMKGGHYTFK